MTAREIPFFFGAGAPRRFGLLHVPNGAPSSRGFVMSHPFAEEKLWSHRVFVSLARALAARGHAVLRFDYAGAGDSGGEPASCGLDSHLADLRAAVAELAARRPGVGSIGFIGLRLGASIAARLAEHAPADPMLSGVQGAPLVLWDPVLDGAAYLQEVLRANLSAQMATHGRVLETREAMAARIRAGGVVNVDGYEIGRAFHDTVGDPALLPATPKAHGGPVLVVGITTPGRPPKPQPALEALARAYARGSYAAVEEHPFWREIKQFYGRAARLEAVTLEWLGTHDG